MTSSADVIYQSLNDLSEPDEACRIRRELGVPQQQQHPRPLPKAQSPGSPTSPFKAKLSPMIGSPGLSGGPPPSLCSAAAAAADTDDVPVLLVNFLSSSPYRPPPPPPPPPCHRPLLPPACPHRTPPRLLLVLHVLHVLHVLQFPRPCRRRRASERAEPPRSAPAGGRRALPISPLMFDLLNLLNYV